MTIRVQRGRESGDPFEDDLQDVVSFETFAGDRFDSTQFLGGELHDRADADA